MKVLTLVLGVVQSTAEDLERASYIEGVVAWVQGEEDLDRLDRSLVVVGNCTHLECDVQLMMEERLKKKEGRARVRDRKMVGR